MQKNILIIIGVIVLIGGIFFFIKSSKESDKIAGDTLPINNLDNTNNMNKVTTATLNTSKGNITIEFFEKESPKTVANFLKLAKEGFYSGIKFHRVIKGFMIDV